MDNSDGISVRYIYSACIVTATPDVKILHDPWFTEGIYDGAWFHFPKCENPIGIIGDVDYIFISHVHPDHYDSRFIKEYFSVYGEKPILIASREVNHLRNKMRADGLSSQVVDKPLLIGRTTVTILPHNTGSLSDLDSLIVIKYNDGSKVHSVVNTNDIVFDEKILTELQAVASQPDILLCGYTGAGPYPQTYFDLDDPLIIEEANKKRLAFFDRYLYLTNGLRAKVNIPFAGKYLLGGRLAHLNRYRGVADAVEVLDIDPRAVVLADFDGAINTATLQPTGVRAVGYSNDAIEMRVRAIREFKMSYELLINGSEIHQLPLKRLLFFAAKKAKSVMKYNSDYYFIIQIPDGEFAVINLNNSDSSQVNYIDAIPENLTPRSEIYIDPRYLFGLLTNVYHWNNAEVGSQFVVRRVPNIFNRHVQSFLNFLSI